MPDKLTCLAEYLTYQEGILLYNQLQEAGVQAHVKSCGPPSLPYGEGLYFQLLVSEEDLSIASEIMQTFQREVQRLRQGAKCPRCKSETVFPVRTLPFWQKIYFAGTQVYGCNHCGKRFGN